MTTRDATSSSSSSPVAPSSRGDTADPLHGLGDESHWRDMAADTVNHFWFTNREASVLFAEIDRLRALLAVDTAERTRLQEAVEWAEAQTYAFEEAADEWKARALAAEQEVTALRAQLAHPWQPMETMHDEGQMIVCWSTTPATYDTIGRAEYLEIMGYGEPPALGWMPLPEPPT